MDNTGRNAAAEIQALIERWANAVQEQDLETILADHANDLVTFDVPPPNELRGIEAYRESWGPFFERFNTVAFSRSSGSRSRLAIASPLQPRCCDAAPGKSWKMIPRPGCV